MKKGKRNVLQNQLTRLVNGRCPTHGVTLAKLQVRWLNSKTTLAKCSQKNCKFRLVETPKKKLLKTKLKDLARFVYWQ